MKIPRSFTTVTKLSKTLALFLFILLPLLGFYLGLQTRELPEVRYVTQEKIVKVPAEENDHDLIKRCGKIPSEDLKILKGHYDVVTGPSWAPDCRHIAWSIWQSGTSFPTDDITSLPTLPKNEGLYMYTDASKKVEKIAVSQSNGIIVFKKWISKNKFLYTYNETDYTYELP